MNKKCFLFGCCVAAVSISAFSQSPQTLNPDGVGGSNAWTDPAPAGPGELNDADDATGDTTLWTETTNIVLLHVTMGTFTIPANNGVTKVKIWVKAKTSGNDQIDIGVGDGTSTSLAGSAWSSAQGNITLTTTLTWYWEEWATSPSGGGWTQAKIDALEVRVQSAKVGGASTNSCAKIYAEVYYKPKAVYIIRDGVDDATRYLTIQEGVDAVGDVNATSTTGVIVEIRDNDSYAENVLVNTTKVSNTSLSKPFTIRRQTGSTASIDCKDSYGIDNSGVNYMILDNVRLTRSNTTTIDVYAVRYQNCVGSIIKNCEIDTNMRGGIQLVNGDDCLIEKNKIHDIDRLYAATIVPIGLQLDTASTGNEVKDNLVWNIMNTQDTVSYGDGIWVGAGPNYIHNNVIWNCERTGILFDAASDSACWNNTIDLIDNSGSTAGDCAAYQNTTNNLRMRNNLFTRGDAFGIVARGASPGTGTDGDYNLFFGNGGGTTSGYTEGSNSQINVNPNYVDPDNATVANKNFREQSTFGHWNGATLVGPPRDSLDSPAIDKGVPAPGTAITISELVDSNDNIDGTIEVSSLASVPPRGFVYINGEQIRYTGTATVPDRLTGVAAGLWQVDGSYASGTTCYFHEYYYASEPEDNGNRVNQGAYGGTSESSLSGVRVTGSNDDTINSWTGNANTTSWNTANNWSKKAVPAAGEKIYIPDRTYDPVLDVSTASIASLTISSYSNNSPAQTTGNLTMNNSSYSATITGGLVIDSGSTWSHSAGAVNVAGDVTINGTFTDTGGTFVLNSTSANQTVSGSTSPTFYSLEINNTFASATIAMPTGAWGTTLHFALTAGNSVTVGSGTVTIGGNLNKNSAGGLTSTSGTLNVAGNFSMSAGTFTHNSGTVTMNGTSNQTLTTGGVTFNNVSFSNTSSTAVVTISGNLVVAGALTLAAANTSTVSIGNGTHTWTGAVTSSGGTLKLAPTSASTYTASAGITVATGTAIRLEGPSTLKLPAVGMTVNGDFIVLAETARPKITTTGTPGTNFYDLVFNPTTSSDTLDIFGLDIDSADAQGLDVAGNTTQIVRIDDINFTNGANDTSLPNGFTNTYLTLRVTSGTYTFRLNDFDKYCKYNVKISAADPPTDGYSTAVISMENSGGAKGDSSGTDTPSGGGNTWTGEGRDGDPDSDGHITWKYFKKWIGSINTMWSLGANWEGGTAPSTTAPYDDVLISPGAPYNPILDADATVNSFTIDSGGVMNLGSTSQTLTIRGDNFRTFGGTMSPGNGTIVFSGPATQIVNVGVNPLYNVRIEKPSGFVNLAANLVVRNDFVLVDGTYDMKGYRMDVGDATYGTTMALKLDDDNDGDGSFIMGTTSTLTTIRAATTNKTTFTMSGTASWTADDGTGANNATITIGPATGSGGSLTVSDSSKIVVGDGDGTDSITTQNGATFTMTASSSGSPRLELAGGTAPASATFNTNFVSTRSGSNKPVITRRTADSSGNYSITMASTVDIQGLAISYQNSVGLNITSAATFSNLNFIDFTNVPGTTDSGHLKIARAGSGSLVAEGCTFDSSFVAGTGGNIYVSRSDGGGGTFTLYLSNSSGAGSGDSGEDTTGGTVSQLSAPNTTDIQWVENKTWLGHFDYKQQLSVASGASGILANQVIKVTYDGSTSPTAATVLTRTGSDKERIRAFYNSGGGSTWKEVERDVRSFTSTSVVIHIKVQANIPASTTNTEYWIAMSDTITGNALSYNSAIFEDDTETDKGWARDAASNSADQPWERDDPTSITTTVEIQPADDNTASPGIKCWVTGSGSDTTFNFNANEILNSPAINLSSAVRPEIQYYRYYSEAGNNGNQWLAEHTSGGNPNTTLETITTNQNSWQQVTQTIPSPHNSSTTYRLRIDVSKNAAGVGNVLEMNGLIDDVAVFNGRVSASLLTESAVTTSSWSEPLNWSPPGVPTSNSAVILNAGYAVALDYDVIAGATILSLELKSTSPGAMTLNSGAGTLTITRSISFGVSGGATTGSISNVNGRTIQVGGNWTMYTGSSFTAGTGTVVFNGGIAQTIGGSGATTFNNVTVSVNGANNTTLTINPDSGVTTTVAGTLTIDALQEVVVGSSRTLKVASSAGTATTVTVNGTLTLKDGSTLNLEGNASPDLTTVTVNSGGLFRTSGTTSSARATITSDQTTIDTNGYAITVAEGTVINLNYYNFYYPGQAGLQINGGTVSAIGGLNNGNFDYPSNSGILLNFINYNHSGTQTITGCDFKNTGAATGVFNVRGAHLTTDTPVGSDGTNHGIITFTSVTGTFSGEANDQDPNAVLTWPDTAGPVVPELTSAVADDNSGGGMGVQFGDRVVLTFDDPTNAFDVTSGAGINTNLALSNSHVWGTIISAVWSTTTNPNDTLTITLGSGATVAPGDTMTIAAATIRDPTDTSNATDSPVTAIAGTFGADRPDMTMAKADDPKGTQVGGADASDVVVLKFSKPVNAYPIASATVDTVLKPANGAKTWGSPISVVYSGTTTNLTAAYTGTGTLTVADTSAFPASVATANTVFVHGDDFTYTGKTANTFTGVAGLANMDNNATVYRNDTTTLTAAYSGGGTLTVGDTSVFSASVSTALTIFVNGDDFTYTAKTATTFTGVAGLANKNNGDQVYYNNVDTLVVKIDTGNTTATVGVGDTITIGANTIMDVQTVNSATGSPPQIIGDFGVTTVTVSAAKAADPLPLTSGSDSGDTVTLTFDNPTNGYEITSSNIGATLTLSGFNPASPAWGTITSAVWSNGFRTLTITLGSGSSMLATGDAGPGDTQISIAAVTIKDSSGTNNCSAGPFSITDSFGTAPLPTLQSIIAEDSSGNGPGVQNGDRLVFTFDNPTDGDTTAIATMVPLSGTAVWGALESPAHAGGNQQWIDINKILVVYVGTDCTIVPGTTQANANPSGNRNQYIESGAGTNPGSSAPTTDDSIGWPMTIGGSFGSGLSGYLYDDPDTPLGISGKTIRVLVNGADKGTASTDAAGKFTKNVTAATGDKIFAYVDGDTNFGSTVTVKGSGDSIGDLNVYQNYVTVRNHNGAAATNSDISAALGGYSDTDIRFSLSGSDITITATTPNQTLYILNDYTPGGVISIPATGHFRLGAGTFTPGALTHTISGNWDDSAASGGFVPTSGTINFTGTGTIKQRSASTRNQFYKFVVSGGTRTFAATDSNSDGSVEITGPFASNVVQSGATLQLAGGNALRFATSGGMTVNAGGTLSTSGTTATSRATITRTSGSTSYGLTIAGTINMKYTSFYYPNTSGVSTTAWSSSSSLDFCNFDFPAATSPLLNLGSIATSGTSYYVMGCKFENSANVASAINVKGSTTAGTDTFTFMGYSGSLAADSTTAESKDDDANNRIIWSGNNGQTAKNFTTGKYYDTINAAIAAASHGDIIETGNNRVFTGDVTLTKEVTLRNFIINGNVTFNTDNPNVADRKMYNCVVIGNVTEDVGSSATVRLILNCTVSGNMTLTGSGARIKNCVYVGALTATGATTVTNLQGTTADFIGSGAKDYHLVKTSSAVDTGTDISAEMLSEDFEGNSRPVDALAGDQSPVGPDWDIGADEYNSSGNQAGYNTSQMGLVYMTSGGAPFQGSAIRQLSRNSRPTGASFSPALFVAEGTNLHLFNITTNDKVTTVNLGVNNNILGFTQNGGFRLSNSDPLIFALAVDTDPTPDGLADAINIVKDTGSSISSTLQFSLPLNEVTTQAVQFSLESGVLKLHVITRNTSTGEGWAHRYVFNADYTIQTLESTISASVPDLEFRTRPEVLAPISKVYVGKSGNGSGQIANRINSDAAGLTVDAVAIAQAPGLEASSLVPLFVEQPGGVTTAEAANRLCVASPTDGTKIYMYKYDTLALLATVDVGTNNTATHTRSSAFMKVLFLGAGTEVYKVARNTGDTLGTKASSPLMTGMKGNVVDRINARGFSAPQVVVAVTDDGYIYGATTDWSVLNPAGSGLADSPYRLPGIKPLRILSNFGDGFYVVTEDGYIVRLKPF